MDRLIYAFLAVGLFLLAAPAGASTPDTIADLSTDAVWVTAGSGETSTVTALVKNGSTLLSGITVTFTVDGTDGAISPAQAVTDDYGKASAVFKPGTVAGTATITATVSHEELDEPLTKSVGQEIDHAAPYAVSNLQYDSEVTAGDTADIVIRMHDRYGNPVDNRNTAETVTFTVGRIAGGTGATFIGGTDEITVVVDADGNAAAELRVDTKAGQNIVYIRPPKSVKEQYITITGLGGVPSSISLKTLPGNSVRANGIDVITLQYTLFDEYGNLASGQGLWVNASGLICQEELFYSSFSGEVWAKYKSGDSIGVATIIATSLENPSVTNTTEVEFTSTEPVKMVVSASPQTMASRDLKGDVVSVLRAKVMDVKGNPVDGEEVTFIIDTGSINVGGSNSTGDPYLGEVVGQNEIKIITTDGSATVHFHPGSFAKPEAGEVASAKGNVTVRAKWGDVERPIELTWVNYPYLSVETFVSDDKISVNSTDEHTTNTTYVTIRVKGDGYAMQPDPVDAVLVIDTSGSMAWDIDRDSGSSNKRMKAAKAAAINFTEQMDLITEGGDRVALVSFANDASVKLNLINNLGTITSGINALSPSGATNMRQAYYTAIKHLKDNGRPEAVKAVILMGDGDWNRHGSPLAKGTGLKGWSWSGNTILYDYYEYYMGLGGNLKYGKITAPEADFSGKYYNVTKWTDYCPSSIGAETNQNMSNYANSGDDTKKVKIYSIGFASNLSTDVETDLTTLSEATGGKYVWASDAKDLESIYTDIAGELKNEASVDTSMTIFQNVEVNGTPIAAYTIFDYKYEDGRSTTVEGWVHNKTGDYPNIPAFTTIDQTDTWKQDKQLHFDIGTIHLGQTWETTFCLAVKPSYTPGEENNINIFGPGAVISFNSETEVLNLPDTYITVFPDLIHAELETSPLVVAFTSPDSGSGPYTDTVPLTWDTTYKGTEGVSVSLAYSRHEDMRLSTPFLTRTLGVGKFMNVDNTTHDLTQMDVRDLASGKYWITVTATARDADTSTDTIYVWAHSRDDSRAYIKIT